MTLDDERDSESSPCPKCDGEGYPNGEPCEACKGTGCPLGVLKGAGHVIPIA